ncbi:HU family DNA-binding protein [Candidatus Odyssella thessalonicensis]|uniref:HU family DNA-binding protein n=1 Tax=Candidatus Odyssella thessalonicensis TaxID=84647 RepID=UPI000225AEA9|nr:HU family DNA-binding protein [Candidatus Odyssella thessalonicensis]
MNKTDLIKAAADQCGMSQNTVSQVFDAVLKTITDTLKKKEEVNLPGFGKFKITERAARKGRNPQTGAEINIAASNSPVFTAGKGLKDAVN